VFLINIPIALLVIAISLRGVPESRDEEMRLNSTSRAPGSRRSAWARSPMA